MSEAPRLLLISFAPFPAATGAATRLAQRIATFAEAGYTVDVLTPKTPELPHVSKLMGARILRVPMPTGREVRAVPVGGAAQPSPFALRHAAFDRAIRRQLLSNEYDLIHTSDPFTGLTVLSLRGPAKVAYDAPAGLAPCTDHALAVALRRRDRELVRGADVVLVPSEVLALRAKGLGAAPAAIHVLRPATDLDLFAPAATTGDARRPVQVAVLAASLSTPELDLLLEAAAALAPELDVVFEVSAEVREAEHKRIAATPGGRRIRVVAPVLYEDLGPFFAEAAVGLVLDAGPVEGHVAPPRLQCVAEMMAAGLAPVLPDVAAVREIAEHRRHALLVPPGDGAAVASAVAGLAAQPARRQLLAQAARARAMEAMDDATASHQLQAIYQRILAPPSISVALEPPRAPTTTSAPSQATGHTSPSTTGRRVRPALSSAAVPDDPPTAPDAAPPVEDVDVVLLDDLGAVDVPLDDL